MRQINASEARAKFADLVNSAAFGDERIIITRSGKEVVALVPFADLQLLDFLESRIDVEEAKKEIEKAPKNDQKRIIASLGGLATDPRPSGVEKLQENPKFWRLRSGDYRVVYWVDDENKMVAILLTKKRGDAYRNLGDLNQILAAINLDEAARAIVRGIKH